MKFHKFTYWVLDMKNSSTRYLLNMICMHNCQVYNELLQIQMLHSSESLQPLIVHIKDANELQVPHQHIPS